jgi:phosphotriesterase-related protein
MPQLITTLGPKSRQELGRILPHEHVFVDLRTWDQPGYGEANADDVVALMAPEIERARAHGVTALVEPSGIGVGRRADLILAVSSATGFPIVVPTGVYREPWMPPWVHEAGEDALCDWMTGELSGEIEDTGVQAGWIKVSAGDDGITPAEAKVLRAAGAAAAATGATVGSHTARGRVALEQLAILQGVGARPDQFICIHTQMETDDAIHHEFAAQGGWIEYDTIGEPGSDERYVDLIHRAIDAGFERQILLSHDRGWYDPAHPKGGTPRPYTYLFETFLPTLIASGIPEATVERLLTDNPFRAFAR